MYGSRRIALAVASVAVCSSSAAQQAGDWVLGAGWLYLSPQDSSSPLTFTAPVPAVVPGSGASIGSASTLGLSASYFVTSRWAVEGMFGIPPKFDLAGRGTLATLGKLGSARQWSPTVLGKYYFGQAEARWRAYLGAGVTYVRYRDVILTSSLQGALNSRIGLPPGASTTRAGLDSSFAPVVSTGIAWQIDRHWGAMFSLSYIQLKTTAHLTSNRVGSGLPLARSEARVKINPIVSYLAATYRF